VDNLQVLWTLVDAYRRSADDLEADARRLGGDQPVHSCDHDAQWNKNKLGLCGAKHSDKIDLYRDLIDVLGDARDALSDVAKQEGKPREPRKFASKCHVYSRRCDAALDALLKLGELQSR
jgi:hypothetical protein